MEQSFLDYSMSVIVQRALPDVRDGLKPVHRRILYTMYENTLWPEKGLTASAPTPVGSVLGRYHPHGDAAVYDAMVRLAQDFSMRYMLVDGHGNFGSIDGDPPGRLPVHREPRMNKLSVEMLQDIDKETVDFQPELRRPPERAHGAAQPFPQPPGQRLHGHCRGHGHQHPAPQHGRGHRRHVLPHRQPRGHSGGADGAHQGPRTSPPEALSWAAAASGPPTPPAGAASPCGHGRRSRRRKDRPRRSSSPSCPYQVNKARLIESIADLVKDKRIEGISNIDDHSDRNGMHIVIDVKRDASPRSF